MAVNKSRRRKKRRTEDFSSDSSSSSSDSEHETGTIEEKQTETETVDIQTHKTEAEEQLKQQSTLKKTVLASLNNVEEQDDDEEEEEEVETKLREIDEEFNKITILSEKRRMLKEVMKKSVAEDKEETKPNEELLNEYLSLMMSDYDEDLDELRKCNDLNEFSLPVLASLLKDGGNIWSMDSLSMVMKK